MQNSHLTPLLRKFGCLLALTVMLSACGFQMRGVADLAFKKLYMQGKPTAITRDLIIALETNGVTLVENAETAELLLEVVNEAYEKRILSLSGTGVVREFELNYQINFRSRDPASPIWSAVQSVQSRRDFSYNDSALLGKADEENMLNADMRKDAVRELIRRLTAIKPGTQLAQ